MPNLFQLGSFVLNSGAESQWKIECDALTDEDWSALAAMVRQMVGPFSSVEGVPRGGLKLASKLAPFVGLGGAHLIVDDVMTTGGSMSRLMDVRRPELLGSREIVGAVVFSRGQRSPWIKALFQMPECFWLRQRQR